MQSCRYRYKLVLSLSSLLLSFVIDQETRANEAAKMLQDVTNRLSAQLKGKLLTLLSTKNEILKESHLLESLIR